MNFYLFPAGWSDLPAEWVHGEHPVGGDGARARIGRCVGGAHGPAGRDAIRRARELEDVPEQVEDASGSAVLHHAQQRIWARAARGQLHARGRGAHGLPSGQSVPDPPQLPVLEILRGV